MKFIFYVLGMGPKSNQQYKRATGTQNINFVKFSSQKEKQNKKHKENR